MSKQPQFHPSPRIYVSAQTIHVLYPNLPLKDLPVRDNLYDALAAFDLAQALGMRNPPPEPAQDISLDPKPELKLTPADVLIVDDKEYFSTRVTAHRTGYTPDRLRQLAAQPDSGIIFVRHDMPNGPRRVLFFDVESVEAYRAKHG